MEAASSLRVTAFNPQSPQENTAIVRSMYAAFSSLAHGGGIDTYVDAYFDADCEYQPVEEASTIRGREALIRWVERWLEAWDDAWDEIDEIVEAGGRVVAAIRAHGRGRRSGMEISQPLFDVFDLRDGRVLRIREYLEFDQALRAAGLPR
ncbi:MAG TPA: nuclear transport factor 2 family protein [Solirubrobacterales bacterium]|nr:nuclear transport factor 2 family protein [Solirubrobacterales bacterium]